MGSAAGSSSTGHLSRIVRSKKIWSRKHLFLKMVEGGVLSFEERCFEERFLMGFEERFLVLAFLLYNTPQRIKPSIGIDTPIDTQPDSQ